MCPNPSSADDHDEGGLGHTAMGGWDTLPQTMIFSHFLYFLSILITLISDNILVNIIEH